MTWKGLKKARFDDFNGVKPVPMESVKGYAANCRYWYPKYRDQRKSLLALYTGLLAEVLLEADDNAGPQELWNAVVVKWNAEGQP